jgi:hypothetical protein
MSANPPLDIEVLMERIRGEVTRRRKSTAPELLPEPSRAYTPGTLVRFGTGGNASQYTIFGWSQPEAAYQWTDGDHAELIFIFEKPPGDLVLSFTAQPLIGGGVEAQEVSASWNGSLVGEWTIREAKSYHTIVLSHICANSMPALLRFDFPLSFSPLSKQLSADPRRLGLAFQELVLRPASELGL